MEKFYWIARNWAGLLDAVGTVSLLFAAYSIRQDGKARQIGNYFALVHHHHNLWKELDEKPKLARILDPKVKISRAPVTLQEELFVTRLILHLDSAYRAADMKMFVPIDGLQFDIKTLFSLPIPKAIWEKVKIYHNKDFVAFVEKSLG